jgi:hypothetical protein
VTLAAAATPAQSTLIGQMISQANANKVGLIVKGRRAGLERGWQYLGANNFQSDRQAETISAATLIASGAAGSEITYTVVPKGTERRAGIDRDLDNVLDRDELDQGSDPADPRSYPGSSGTAFCLGDGSGTPCPCGNASASALESGCLNSINTAGHLFATGVASLTGDTIELWGSAMTASSFALFVQGESRENFGCGIVLYDGLDCTGGNIVRLGSRTNAGGASSYPSGIGLPVSVRGNVLVPGTRSYQVFYRKRSQLLHRRYGQPDQRLGDHLGSVAQLDQLDRARRGRRVGQAPVHTMECVLLPSARGARTATHAVPAGSCKHEIVPRTGDVVGPACSAGVGTDGNREALLDRYGPTGFTNPSVQSDGR